MPNWLVEEIEPITLQQFIGNVAGKREHRQKQDAASGVDGHIADGEPDWAQAGPAGLTAISPTRRLAGFKIPCLR